MAWIIVPLIAVLVAILALLIRSGLTRLRDDVRQSWHQLDLLLLERHDLMPGLLECCAGHLQYEQEAFERVAKADAAVARAAAAADIPALSAAEKSLRDSIARLLAIAENYPQLGADPAFASPRDQLERLGPAIDEGRERYNCSANLQNVRGDAFPYRLLARSMGIRPAALLA